MENIKIQSNKNFYFDRIHIVKDFVTEALNLQQNFSNNVYRILP